MDYPLSLLLPQLQPALGNLFAKMLARLVLAAFLGGIIGLERELKHRPAGLRTNMFICFGAAMFTVLSIELAQGNEATRIASQIIPGIGFIGAGSILRDKGGVTGLTTAATIFVVASIGMACGGGLYLLAIFATVLLFLALQVLGWMERRWNLKPLLMNYSVVSDKSTQEIVDEINKALEEQAKELRSLRLNKVNGKERVSFSVGATRSEHAELLERLRQCPELGNLQSTPGPEIE
ncbi:MAG TPA: MgtC/SapB family protein [Candidatus Angelobacter sp.]|jgi:putative Mg2+ transporter-C (MgtC) family protein|nr:MgtC/SapB family protein [Candidatus Angelobacter sp.]